MVNKVIWLLQQEWFWAGIAVFGNTLWQLAKRREKKKDAALNALLESIELISLRDTVAKSITRRRLSRMDRGVNVLVRKRLQDYGLLELHKEMDTSDVAVEDIEPRRRLVVSRIETYNHRQPWWRKVWQRFSA